MRYKSILLFGAPGSGKGTQGKILGSIPGFYHSATGDIFRSLDLRSEIGRMVLEYSSVGKLVPDDVTIRVWTQAIRGAEMVNRFHPEDEFILLDGLPRNVSQARLLENTIDVVKIIHLHMGDNDRVIERLRRRALKENRADDANIDTIKRRLGVYEKETKPVLGFYPPEKVVEIDATMSQIRVLNAILNVLVPLKEARDGESDAPSSSL